MRARIRRRRAALAVGLGAVAAAIGLHSALDGGSSKADGFDASRLTVPELAGERLVAGFPSHHVPAALRRLIHQGRIAGVVLFSSNFSDPAGARRLARSLQAIRRPPGLGLPLLVMVDQEGGLVKRLPGAPVASAAEMGRRGAAFSREQGAATATTLKQAGANVDLAPVLDVGRAGSSIRGDQRSFGATAAKVSATAVPFAEGLQGAGVAATGKHFPGLGATRVNTDLGAATVALPLGTLHSVDEPPFHAFSSARGKLVMVSSATYPALAREPAVFAPQVVTGELRDRLGFGGVAISDDLQSGAARAFGATPRVAQAAAAAGTDLLLFRSYRVAARAGTALRRGLTAGSLPREAFVQAAQRVMDLRASLNH